MVRELFNVRSVAVIGASENPKKLGYTIVKNLVHYRFRGAIYPISLHAQTILGIKTYTHVEEVPRDIDLAVIAVPAAVVPEVLRQCVNKVIPLVIVISAGFKETGEQGACREQQLLEIIAGSNTRLLGPNCLGLIDAASSLNASFAANFPAYEPISFISQSGALGAAFLDWISANHLGIHYFISLGNKADLDENYFLERLYSDKLIACYLEDIKDGQQFLQIGQKYNCNRPVIVLKAGRSASAAEAIRSHTGVLAGGYPLTKAALQQYGYIVVETIGDLFHTLKAFAWQPLPTFNRVAIVSNAGGAAVVATDTLIEKGLELADLSLETQNVLRSASIHNPIDVAGDALSERYLQVMEAVLQEEDVSSLLVILTPQVMTEIEKTAAYIGGMKKYGKPILASFIGGTLVDKGLKLLDERKVPAYHFPETALNVLAAMTWYASYRQRTAYNLPTPALKSPYYEEHHAAVNELYQQARALGLNTLPQVSVDELTRRYHIAAPESYVCKQVDQAVLCVRASVGYPCVLKIVAPTLLHKSDIGAVITNIKDEVALREAYYQLEALIRERKIADAAICVQKYIEPGRQLIVGATRDANFGTILLFGSGGIYTELLGDVVRRVAPLERAEMLTMISETRIAPILEGMRGQKAVDIQRIIDVIKAVEYLMQDYDFIQSIDINPLLVSADSICAVDIKIFLNSAKNHTTDNMIEH
ncbi:acetate--CoA ligase family protein [Dictyobacter formicarum]|uniref:Acyl-CoA synthetase n=1 Tax=Dictyobacter formicarum TaxID=2778368 RepID=A0ABQ3VFE4_9CHLR|nr:acetate--CoA ligase [Dictyobacter formicarum]GHO83851.1 acyl-CoA synthetase [Dictyobacter formicarum]